MSRFVKGLRSHPSRAGLGSAVSALEILPATEPICTGIRAESVLHRKGIDGQAGSLRFSPSSMLPTGVGQHIVQPLWAFGNFSAILSAENTVRTQSAELARRWLFFGHQNAGPHAAGKIGSSRRRLLGRVIVVRASRVLLPDRVRHCWLDRTVMIHQPRSERGNRSDSSVRGSAAASRCDSPVAPADRSDRSARRRSDCSELPEARGAQSFVERLRRIDVLPTILAACQTLAGKADRIV
ncbi:MAG: hypothetical protein RLZZ232_3099 [Planctomycetota bacterium]